MSHVFHRTFDASLPTVVGGDGNSLIDEAGKRYLDACGGGAASCPGHGNAEVADAVATQVGRLAFAHTGVLHQRTVRRAGGPPCRAGTRGHRGRSRRVSGQWVGGDGGGAEACTAIPSGERRAGAHEHCRARSYHGNTLGALATGGHAQRRAPYQPMLIHEEIDTIVERIGAAIDAELAATLRST